MSEKPTPGPWEWSAFGDSKPKLMTPHSGRLLVMDFVRAGMQGAQVRFAKREGNKGGLMLKDMTLEQIQAHPDARLIVASCNAIQSAAEKLQRDPVELAESLADGKLILELAEQLESFRGEFCKQHCSHLDDDHFHECEEASAALSLLQGGGK